MDTAEAIDRLWQQIEPVVFITREQFDRGLAYWNIGTVEINGQTAFITATNANGPEFHFASLDTGVPVTRDLIRRLFAPILEKYGCVETRTPKEGADRQHRFNRILGFRPVGESEFFTHYRLEA